MIDLRSNCVAHLRMEDNTDSPYIVNSLVGSPTELVQNNFFDDDSIWVWEGVWSWDDVLKMAYYNSDITDYLHQDVGYVAGKKYVVAFTIPAKGPAGAQCKPWVGYMGGGTIVEALGSYIEAITCVGTPPENLYFGIVSGEYEYWLDNVFSFDLDAFPGTGVFRTVCDGDPRTSAHSVAGKIGKAIALGGSANDYIDTFLKASEIHDSNKFSICMWVKIKTIAANKMFYCSDEGGADRFYLITRGTGTGLGIGLSGWNENFEVNFAADTWYFLVVILDGTTGYVYKDNVLVDSQAGITVNLPTVNTIKLGAGANGLLYNLDCEIDVTGIYNKALSEAKRDFLWNNGNGTERLWGYEYGPVGRGVGRGILRGVR